jgi:hypothetical protein
MVGGLDYEGFFLSTVDVDRNVPRKPALQGGVTAYRREGRGTI